MKRIFSLLLAIALILSLAPSVLALQMTEYAFVTADIPTDRLNLRKTASAEADSLGRYYIGTRVRVLGESGEFTKVEVGEGEGAATGYMLTKFLVPITKDANYHYDIYRAKAKSAGELLNSSTAGGKVIDTFAKWDECIILGDVGDDWRHVQMHGLYGYVRTSRLYEKYAYIWRAHLKADASGVVKLYEQQSLSSFVLGQFLTDTAVEITSMTKNGWAHVNICGTGNRMPGELDGVQFSGYVQNKYLNINDPTLLERVVRRPSELFVVEMTRDVMFDDIEGLRKDSFLMKGTVAAALGYIGSDLIIIQYDGAIGVIPLDATTGTNRYVINGELPIIGYGFAVSAEGGDSAISYVNPSENEEIVLYYGIGDPFTVVGKLPVFFQLHDYDSDSFIPAINTKYYDLDGLFSGTGSFSAGSYAVGIDIKSALYTLRAGKATVTLGDKNKTYESIGDCTFFLPSGATLTIESGSVSPAKREMLLTQDKEFAADISGRYLVGQQMVSRGQWDYKIRMAEGAESAYYIVSSLINDDLSQEITREEMRVDLEPGETYLLTLYESEMVEFHHCDVEVFYGNG